MSDMSVLTCTLRRGHGPHTWWSRKNHCYFRCGGRVWR